MSKGQISSTCNDWWVGKYFSEGLILFDKFPVLFEDSFHSWYNIIIAVVCNKD